MSECSKWVYAILPGGLCGRGRERLRLVQAALRVKVDLADGPAHRLRPASQANRRRRGEEELARGCCGGGACGRDLKPPLRRVGVASLLRQILGRVDHRGAEGKLDLALRGVSDGCGRARCELGPVATVARGVNSARSLLVCGAQQPVTSAC